MWKSINPANGECWAVLPLDDEAQLQTKLERLHQRQQAWRSRPLEARAARLGSLAEICEARMEDAAKTMVREMGKPLTQARAEIRKCAWLCRHVAQHAGHALRVREVELEEGHAWIRFDPLGVILGIMPWNFPFWQVFRFAVPTLMAGNGAAIKHAPNVGQCSKMIVSWFHEAGIDAFDHLIIEECRVEGVIADSRIAAVSLTGSRRAGRAVAAMAGRELKKSVLELGGSDPYLVLDDADLELASAQCVAGRMLNSGQTCIAAKRWIVVSSVYEAFRERVLERMKALKCGNPMDEGTDVGPIAREDLRRQLHAQVRDSIASGARCLLGGELPQGPGYYYPPTLLEDVRPGMPAFDDELFGPVAALIVAEDVEQALALANASPYGLGAGIFTRDLLRAQKLAERLEAGNVAINTFVKSDPRLPFGGIKQSGYGRELSEFGLLEFVNIKTIVAI